MHRSLAWTLRFLALGAPFVVWATCCSDPEPEDPPGEDRVDVEPGQSLPSIRLEDPDGGAHDLATKSERFLVIVATAPNMQSGRRQRAWAKALDGLAKRDDLLVVLLQDMTEAQGGPIPRWTMRSEWSEGTEPLLLLDEDGAVSTALGAGGGLTLVRVYDERRLVGSFGADPDDREIVRIIELVTPR